MLGSDLRSPASLEMLIPGRDLPVQSKAITADKKQKQTPQTPQNLTHLILNPVSCHKLAHCPLFSVFDNPSLETLPGP